MNAHQALVLPFTSSTLVFGLEWFPLVGTNVKRQSRRLARKYGASHMVLSGEQAGSVGMGRIRTVRAARKTPWHSAAQNFATLFSEGTVAGIFALPDGKWWMVAAHEGAVVARTDCLYPSSDDAVRALHGLRPAYPQLRELNASGDGMPPSIARLSEASAAHTALRKPRSWSTAVPLPIQAFVLALGAALSYTLWNSPDKQPTASVAAPADARRAWQLAIEQSLAGRVLHGPHGSRAVLETLQGLPVVISGWRLSQAYCQAGPTKWLCQASYGRQDPQATNQQFLEYGSAKWQIQFLSMDQVQSAWDLPVGGLPVAWPNLKTSAYVDRHLVSALQMLRPAFSQVVMSKPLALPVGQPRDENGVPIARPGDLPVYLSRSVQIDGPLRSFGLLLPHTAVIEWHRMTLTMNAGTQPTLKNSQLSVSLQGVLHEIETLPRDPV